MSFSLSNRALLRGMLAGAVVLTGTACSRSDRSDRSQSGRDTSAAVLPDTSSNADQPSGSTATGAVSDTATGAVSDTAARSSSRAQPSASARSNTPRSKTAPADTSAAAYRSMERDTTNVSAEMSATSPDSADVAGQPDTTTVDPSAGVADTSSTEVAVAADTSASVEVGADTAAAGYVEMARDTSAAADQADTVAMANADNVVVEATADTSSQANADASAEAGVAGAGDTTDNAGRIRPPEDSTEILGAVRVRPPEDSTEILGNVTTDEAVDETADEQIVRPEDRETVAASETPGEVGAAAIAGNVTGAEAIALMSREGVRCAVVDPETNEAVRWDMSSTPVTLNPCGMGSMVLSRIWTRVE